MKSLKGKFNFYRNGWKSLVDFENCEGDTSLKPLIDAEIKKLESQILIFCMDTTSIIENILENHVMKDDYPAIIFYTKLKADYYRYYAEVAPDDEFEQFKEDCRKNYDDAFELCKKYLEYQSPLFLSVALNYSVFLYSLKDDVKLAYEKAEEVYKQAILKIVPDQKIPEVESIIKSIEENLTIWKIELSDFNVNN